MLQGPNKLKNYRLRWLSKPLSFISRMNNHLLIEMTDVLHGVGPPIINSESRLCEPAREFSPINSADKR